jgi:hypothetical protein
VEAIKAENAATPEEVGRAAEEAAGAAEEAEGAAEEAAAPEPAGASLDTDYHKIKLNVPLFDDAPRARFCDDFPASEEAASEAAYPSATEAGSDCRS